MKKSLLIIFLAGGLLFGVALLYANLVILQNKSQIYSENNVPSTTIGLVFGAGMRDDGSMSPMQSDRVKEGVALYKAGKVSQLIMTGDDGGMKADEVGAMRAAAIAAGVPEDKVRTDPHGYRTYESCYREANVYGIKKVIAVSQSFHLPRIVYLCENFGIETVGVPADIRNYGWDQVFMDAREAGARLKALWQVVFTKPLPRNLD